MEETDLYTTAEIAELFKTPTSTVYSRIARMMIKPIKKHGTTKYYSRSQFERGIETVVVFYPMKTTETYWVFQSKMNEL